MNNDIGTIFIIDDDKSVRRSLSLFLLAEGFLVEAYSSAEEYLERDSYNGIGCLILDINMEGMSGLDLQEEIVKQESQLPVVFITGQASIRMSVTALKKGAINFLEKPFKEEDLLHSLSEALTLSRELAAEKEANKSAHDLIDALTPRETEVCKYLITGMLNKQIAYELNIAEQTVKLHRHSICEKLGVKSLPEIIRIADKAGVEPFGKKYD